MSNQVRIALVVCAVLAVVGIFAIVRTRQSLNQEAAPTNEAPSATVQANFVYHKGESYEAKTIPVTQGQHVIVTVTTNVADEVHLHGYDLHVNALANDPATLEFDATQLGTFVIELEDQQQLLGTFEIAAK